MTSDNEQHQYDMMGLALDQAHQAEAVGEVPVGAVLVYKGQVIATGHNQPIGACDPTAHAEIVALRQGARVLGNYRLLDTELYVTLEPCVMCIGAILHARVRRLIYAATDPKMGAVESLFEIASTQGINHQIEIVSNVRSAESGSILKSFFRKRR